MECCVYNRVPDDVHAFVIDPFPSQTIALEFRGTKEPFGNPIREHAVRFLGHAPVITPQSRFEVRDGNSGFVRRERARKHGIRISLNHDCGRLKFSENVRESLDHETNLYGWRMRTHVDVRGRLREVEFIKKDAVQFMRIVLSCMNDANRHPAALRLQNNWRAFDDFRTRSKNDPKHNVVYDYHDKSGKSRKSSPSRRTSGTTY
jgi:hypothetical protein